jgi:aspartate oxidase
VLEGLIRAARTTPSIEIRENLRVTDLLHDDEGRVSGAFCAATEAPDRSIFIPARSVILATGGIGGLFAHTTNPLSAMGGGLAVAARAGAVLRDLEMIQFHPTAIAVGLDPMPLATEALRGEGAILINDSGDRFMEAVPGAELAPRDVVARAVFAQIAAGRSVYLDAREALGSRFCTLFPGVAALCRKADTDPGRRPIPVRPAAHYHMGGVMTDHRGRSTVEGLWACGEAASTGLHGANRLASNSLLEALASANWIAVDLKGSPQPTRSRFPSTLRSLPQPSPRARDEGNTLHALRILMDRDVGVLRDAAGLDRAVRTFQTMMVDETATTERRDAALVSFLIATEARHRRESRGAHQRTDFPDLAPGPGQHTELTLNEALILAAKTDAAAVLTARRVA